MIIEMIQKENDIKKLDHTQLKELAEEIRGFLLDKISWTSGFKSGCCRIDDGASSYTGFSAG